jgi:hypothetical protein
MGNKEIEVIINKTKQAIKDRTYDIVPTSKNRETRRKYAITLEELEEFLESLEAINLIKGPEEDRDYPGEYIYVFKKEFLSGIIFYIKLKEKNNQIKILSCHEDEK